MPFEIEDFAPAKLLDHQTLSDKDREPDANPGQSLFFELPTSNEMLSMFDGSLRHVLYQKNAGKGGQQEIPTSDLPNLTNIASHVKRLTWHETFQGLRLTIDYGVGGSSNLELIDCKALAFRFYPKEGGSLLMKFKVEAPNVPELICGKLPKLKSTEVKIRLVQPEVKPDPQRDITDAVVKTPKTQKPAAKTPEQALAEAMQRGEQEGAPA